MTQTLILLAVATVVIWIIAEKAAESSGRDVGNRFLEVTPDYTADGLRSWIATYPFQAHRYAFPVLFPLDLLFLLTVAGFFAVASIAIASALHWNQEWIRLCAIFPILYATCDLIENILLVRLLVSPTVVTDRSVAVAQTVTGLKFAAVAISAAQLLLLVGLGLLRILFHALR